MFRCIFLSLIFTLCLISNSIAYVKTADVTDYSSSETTIIGTSNPINNYDEVSGTVLLPVTIQIYDSSSAVGTIQGVVATSASDYADTSTVWQSLTDGDISGNATFHIYAPMTHLRVNITTGSCKVKVMY